MNSFRIELDGAHIAWNMKSRFHSVSLQSIDHLLANLLSNSTPNSSPSNELFLSADQTPSIVS